jgi:16S rRNA (guanine527-N7)-methyltransferase
MPAVQDALHKSDIKLLNQGIEQLALTLNPQQVQQLIDYVLLLVKWNKAFNLTAIREPRQMLIKHILDSLSVHQYIADQQHILDVGTGPGIPGVILAICYPQKQFTLLDSNGKKIRFINQAIQSLQLANCTAVKERVEDFEIENEQKFDVIISRAFTALHQMVKVCQHLVNDQGLMLAMKGTYPEPDQQPIDSNWKITQVHKLAVPYLDEQRHLVTVVRH